jgi:hypothetical protein
MAEPDEMAEAFQQALERMRQSARAMIDRAEAQLWRVDETLHHAGEQLTSAHRRLQCTRRLLQCAQGHMLSCSPLHGKSLLSPVGLGAEHLASCRSIPGENVRQSIDDYARRVYAAQ